MKKAFLICLLSLVAACTTLAPAIGVSDKINYAYGGNATARDTCTALFKAKKFTVADANLCLKVTDDVRAALDLARAALQGGNTLTAQQKLDAARAILDELERRLEQLK